jgi:UDP-N-acetylglucosamine acyltransferase
MSTQPEPNIHKTAIVHPQARIGEGVIIGPYSIIGEHVVLGEGTVVGPHVVIEGRTTIGRNNRIFQFASIGSQPQDLKFKGEPATLEIGDGNQIREYVTMNLGTEGGGMVTRVGHKNLFMMSVHIAHDCIVGNGNIFANLATLAGHVTVEDDAILGGMAGVHQFARVGTGSMLSGGAKATLDVPPYCVAHGDRAHLTGLNAIGLRRRGVSSEDLKGLKHAYRVAFQRGHLLAEAVSEIRRDFEGNVYALRLADFLSGSQRGVTRPLSGQTEDEVAELSQ